MSGSPQSYAESLMAARFFSTIAAFCWNGLANGRIERLALAKLCLSPELAHAHDVRETLEALFPRQPKSRES